MAEMGPGLRRDNEEGMCVAGIRHSGARFFATLPSEDSIGRRHSSPNARAGVGVVVGQSAFLTCLRMVHVGCNAGTTLNRYGGFALCTCKRT